MGNRAVITTSKSQSLENNNDIGVYLHWHGSPDTVAAVLSYCKMRGFRCPEKDSYGWARLCQVFGNYIGGDLSIGIDKCKNLDCNNYDNGTYIIENWGVVARLYDYDCGKMPPMDRQIFRIIEEVNNCQPASEQMTYAELEKAWEEIRNG